MSFDLKIESNDLKLNPDGSLQTVRDNSKLIQDVIKAILTPQGSNRFFQWYGSTLNSRVVGQFLDIDIIKSEIERSIQDTLNNVIALQRAQMRTQYVSAGEQIAAIRDISVIRNSSDSRQFEITVSILTRKLTVIEETFTVSI